MGRADRIGPVSPKAKPARCNPARLRSGAFTFSHYLAILGGGLVEISGFDLDENSQDVIQVARCATGCLSGSVFNALAKSVSEFQENPFVPRIAELRLRPCPDSSFRFENTVFHLPA